MKALEVKFIQDFPSTTTRKVNPHQMSIMVKVHRASNQKKMYSLQKICTILMIIVASLHLMSFILSFDKITYNFIESNKAAIREENNVIIPHATLNVNGIPDYGFVDHNSPKLVWLISFPNSGTSFTTKMIRMFTNQYTATNYGEEHIRVDINENMGSSVSLRENDPMYKHGPFLSEDFSNENTLERSLGKFVLTKTHCGVRCSRCNPSLHRMENSDSFKKDCLTARRGYSHKNGTVGYNKHQYDEKLVRKLIHLIRDPFDNIVSRFHLTRKIQKKAGNEQFQLNYPSNADGFRKWCNYMDKKYKDQESTLFDQSITSLFKQVPCHTDFYRYILWHNLAFEMTQSLEIPSLTVHYEDYEIDFNGTKAEIISFLETEEVSQQSNGDQESFIGGKSYRHYFSNSELNAVKELIFELSSMDSRRDLRRYLVIEKMI